MFNSFPESKYYSKDIKKLVSENKAEVIEVDKNLKIDKDKIIIKRIINTEDKTYLRYTVIQKEQGWSFPRGTIIMYDDKQRLYEGRGGCSSGKVWGQEGIIDFERLNDDANYIVLKLDWYDRKDELKISLKKEGEANENK